MATQLALDMKAEAGRFAGQCARILGRLQEGRVTNRELSHISLKYTGRLSDLRKRGHDIRVVKRCRITGLTWYALFVEGQECHPC